MYTLFNYIYSVYKLINKRNTYIFITQYFSLHQLNEITYYFIVSIHEHNMKSFHFLRDKSMPFL